MTVDAIEMLQRLGETEPIPAEVSDRAKMALRAAIAAEGDPKVVQLPRHPRRRRRQVALGGGLAGVAAAAAAVALVAGSSAPATGPAHTANAPLVRLADSVSKFSAPAGNATLIARTTSSGSQAVTVYDLYADNGEYFFSATEAGLPAQVSGDHNQGNGVFAREIAAARQAASGNVAAGAEAMAIAPDPGHGYVSPTAKPADKPNLPASTGNLYDNWVWENSEDALVAGAGEPQVRAGVLRILATLPGVTVTSGTSGGQATQVLTAGSAEIGTGQTEQLAINSANGIPVSLTSGNSTVSYRVSRVTTSDIAAGKF